MVSDPMGFLFDGFGLLPGFFSFSPNGFWKSPGIPLLGLSPFFPGANVIRPGPSLFLADPGRKEFGKTTFIGPENPKVGSLSMLSSWGLYRWRGPSRDFLVFHRTENVGTGQKGYFGGSLQLHSSKPTPGFLPGERRLLL